LRETASPPPSDPALLMQVRMATLRKTAFTFREEGALIRPWFDRSGAQRGFIFSRSRIHATRLSGRAVPDSSRPDRSAAELRNPTCERSLCCSSTLDPHAEMLFMVLQGFIPGRKHPSAPKLHKALGACSCEEKQILGIRPRAVFPTLSLKSSTPLLWSPCTKYGQTDHEVVGSATKWSNMEICVQARTPPSWTARWTRQTQTVTPVFTVTQEPSR
jgi:hypothetical protein